MSKAVVTGASSGIGAAVAARLRAGGYEVVGVSRRGAAAGATAEVRIDLGDIGPLPARVEELAAAHGDAEVLVLCAGAGRFGSLEEQSYEQIRDLVDLNLVAQIFLCRAFLPHMKRRGAGVVVLVGSEAAHRAGRRGAVYSATKFALRGLAEALREEAAKSGVRVSLVSPGMTRTPFFEPLDFAPGEDPDNALETTSVAEAVWLAASAGPHAVVDEVRLSPLKKVVRRKRRGS